MILIDSSALIPRIITIWRSCGQAILIYSQNESDPNGVTSTACVQSTVQLNLQNHSKPIHTNTS